LLIQLDLDTSDNAFWVNSCIHNVLRVHQQANNGSTIFPGKWKIRAADAAAPASPGCGQIKIA